MTGASFQHRSPHGCLLSRSWSHDDHLLFTERSNSSAAVVARAICAKTAFGKYTGDFQSHKVQFRNLLPLKANKFGAFSLCSAFENLHRQYLHFFQWLQKKKKKSRVMWPVASSDCHHGPLNGNLCFITDAMEKWNMIQSRSEQKTLCWLYLREGGNTEQQGNWLCWS